MRVGLVGYGLAGATFHAPLIAATAGLELTAVVVRDPGRAAAAASAHPAAARLADLAALLDLRPAIDLVVIATPNRWHAPLAIAALEAGRAVVVDKPLAAGAADAARIIATARRVGAPLTVFHNRRWDDDFLTARDLLAGGRLGPIARFESRFERYRPVPADGWREQGDPDDGGGVLVDLGSHLVDQARVLFGEPIAIAGAVATRRPGARTDDDALVTLRFAGGEVALISVSAIVTAPGPRLRLVGLHGVFEVDGLDPQEAALRAGVRPGGAGWGRAAERAGRLTVAADGVVAREPVALRAGDYPAFYAGLRDALAAGRAPPVDPDDGLAVLRILEAARRG